MNATANTPNDHTKKRPRALPCVCQHPYQDKRYGTGNRLHNPTKEGGWRCTVCGRKGA